MGRNHRRKTAKSGPYLESILTESYTEAVKQAKAETGLPLETFPTECPYELIAVMDDEFLPQ
jgi:hypothetical protein